MYICTPWPQWANAVWIIVKIILVALVGAIFTKQNVIKSGLEHFPPQKSNQILCSMHYCPLRKQEHRRKLNWLPRYHATTPLKSSSTFIWCNLCYFYEVSFDFKIDFQLPWNRKTHIHCALQIHHHIKGLLYHCQNMKSTYEPHNAFFSFMPILACAKAQGCQTSYGISVTFSEKNKH